VLNLLFRNSSSLALKAAPPVALSEVLPGGAMKTLTFAKGAAVFASAGDAKLIGQKAVIAERVAINNVSLDSANDAGFVFHWPVGVNAKLDGTRAYFGSSQKMDFTLHNVSSKDVGPSGVQIADVQFTWVSASIPGADAEITLADGRKFTLGTPYDVKDFTIRAKSQLALPISVKVANSKNFLTANGKVKINVILKSFASDGSDMVDTAATSEFLALDLRPYDVDRTVDIAKRTYCIYNRQSPQPPESRVAKFMLSKSKGEDKMHIRYVVEGQKSPTYTVGAWDFAIYTDLLKSNEHNLVLRFLNDTLAPLTQKDQEYFAFSGCHSF
jgi:hypothetical protein